MTNDESMTKTAVRYLRGFRISSFRLPSAFVIRHSSFMIDIPRPDESFDQFAVCAFCSGGPAHGPRDLDAAAKERRSGSGIWRCGHRKHFRCANDKRAREVHDLAGRYFLLAHSWVVGFVL